MCSGVFFSVPFYFRAMLCISDVPAVSIVCVIRMRSNKQYVVALCDCFTYRMKIRVYGGIIQAAVGGKSFLRIGIFYRFPLLLLYSCSLQCSVESWVFSSFGRFSIVAW